MSIGMALQIKKKERYRWDNKNNDFKVGINQSKKQNRKILISKLITHKNYNNRINLEEEDLMEHYYQVTKNL